MKRTYIQPIALIVSTKCISCILAGSPLDQKEHEITRWVGAREDNFDEEDETDGDSESFW